MKLDSRCISRAATILTLVATAGYCISLAKAAVGKPSVWHFSGRVTVRSSIHTARTSHLAKEYDSLPLSFEANEGQTDASVQFVSHGADYTLFLRRNDAVLELQKPDDTDTLLKKMDPKARKRFEARKFYRASPRFHRYRRGLAVGIALVGANSHVRLESDGELPGKSNYFIGSNRRKWLGGIPNYARVRYVGIYPGVDLVYYGREGRLEFDFVVSPGADPTAISLKFTGGERISIDRNGDLRLTSHHDFLLLHRPVIYQIEHNSRRPVQGGFVLLDNNRVSVQVSRYDRSKPLIIDPVLTYSTYLGGNAGGIAMESWSIPWAMPT
ncbi:MAG: hypothetical protein WA876_13100 [Candidatus Acidiferrales bacterium]